MVRPGPFRNVECRVDRPGRQINDFGRIIIGTANCPGPCEDGRGFDAGTPNRFQRGQQISVSWLRNGHGLGGAVRWSIVNVDKNDYNNKNTFNERAFHVECFVQRLVDCGGPCGTDDKRYESTLRIPTSLPDGRYRLQWIWFGGPDPSPNGNFGDYYNCADLYISGGQFEDSYRVANMPTCYTISTRVGECAQEPCRTGEPASHKRINEIPDGKSLGSNLWGGNGGGGGPAPTPRPAAPTPQQGGGGGGEHCGACTSSANPNLHTGVGFQYYSEECKQRGGLGCIGNTGCRMCTTKPAQNAGQPKCPPCVFQHHRI